MVQAALDHETIRQRLSLAVSEWHAGGEVEVLEPVGAGSSSVTVHGILRGCPVRDIIIKVAPLGLPAIRNRDVLREARVLRYLKDSDVPVPTVLFESDGDPPDTPPFFAMVKVPGFPFEPLVDEIADPQPLPQTLAARAADAARVLAALHRHGAAEQSELIAEERSPGLAEVVSQWGRMVQRAGLGLERDSDECVAELLDGLPSELEATLVHGDFRLGNLVCRGNSVKAVIDWEIWSLGDSRIDLGWFLMTANPALLPSAVRGAPDGYPTPTQLLHAYEAALGRSVDQVTWFIALACLRGAGAMALNVKHNRRRPTPDARIERYAALLPQFIANARALANSRIRPS